MSANGFPDAPRRPGAFARAFPFAVIGLATAALMIVWLWPGKDTDSSSLSMAKMGTILVAAGLLLVWALRMSGWRRRFVWLGVLALIGLPTLVWKPSSMSGKFFPIFVPRDWVSNAFLGGSPDTVLERHRKEQGKADARPDLTIKEGDWPAFRGPNRDGVVTGPKLARDWSKTPPRLVWRQPVGGGYAAFVVANGFLVTIEQRREQEVVACYEAAAGREVWTAGWDTRFSESAGGVGPRATPTIAQGDVFAYGAAGRLVCLNGVDGKGKWAVQTLEGNENLRWAMSGSPLVVDDLVIVNPGAQNPEAAGKALQAYNRTTGKLVWASGSHKAGYCSPQLSVLGGRRQVLIFDGEGLAGHDPGTGAELWRVKWKVDYDINVAQPMVLADDLVAIASGYNKGGALLRVKKEGDAWKAAEVWRTRNKDMRYKFASGVVRDGHAYGLNDGLLECVDLKTGKPVWKDDRHAKEGEGFGHGQLLLCDDLIVALTEYGELVLVEATPAEFRELGRIKALEKGPKTWNTPAMAHGRVYVRNEEEMACYDMTGP